MKKPMLFLIPVIFFALAGAGFASSLPLYWEEVLSLAKMKSPDLRTGEEEVELARLGYIQSYTNFLPSVSGSAGWSRSGDGHRYAGGGDGYSYSLSGRVSLFSGFGDLNRLRASQIDYESARESYRRTTADAYYNLRRSFLELLWAQENIELSRQILGRRVENLDLVRLKYEAGLEDLGSLLRMEADHNQAQRDYEQARRRAEVYGRRMAQDIGLDEGRILTAAGNLIDELPDAVPEMETGIGDLIETVPEHLIAALRVEKAGREVSISRSSFSPELSLSTSHRRSGDDWKAEDGGWSLGMQLSIPIFSSGGRDFVNARMVRVRETIAEENLRRTTHRLGTDLHSSRVDLVNAWDDLNVRRKYLEASAEQSRIITTKYLNGLISYLEWHRVENDYISAQRSMLNAHRDAALALARWLRTLGRAEEKLLPEIMIANK